MGYKTVIIVNNDTIHHAKNDPNFGQRVYDAVVLVNSGRSKYDPTIEAVHQSHTDNGELIMFDGLCAKLMASTQIQKDTDVVLLKEMADSLGYRIVRKSEKK